MPGHTARSPRRAAPPRGGGPIPIAAAAAAAAAAATGAGLGWVASRRAHRRTDEELEEQEAGRRALDFRHEVASSMADYGDIYQDLQNIETTISREKKHAKELEKRRDGLRRVLAAIEDVRGQYHRVPYPLRPKAEILVPKPSLMRMLRQVKYTKLIRRVRSLAGGGGKVFTRFDDEALQYLRKHHTEPLAYLETRYSPDLHPQLEGRVRHIERTIESAATGESFHVDGTRFESMRDMRQRLDKVTQRHQALKAEMHSLQRRIESLNTENTKIEIDIGQTCDKLFRKWLKAGDDPTMGVPIRVISHHH